MHRNFRRGVLRIPLLSINYIEKLRIQNLSTENILATIRGLCTPIVLEALYISSPVYYKELQELLKSTECTISHSKVLNIWLGFVKYYSRMCSRATPFGLMGSVGVVNLGQSSYMQKVSRGNIHVQLDNSIVAELSSYIQESFDIVNSNLLYHQNPSIYKNRGSFKYLETRLEGNEKIFILSKFQLNIVVKKILSYCSTGRKKQEILDYIMEEMDNQFSVSEIEDLIIDMISNQILLSSFSRGATIKTPFLNIVETIEQIGDSPQILNLISVINNKLKSIKVPNWPQNKATLKEIERDLLDLGLKKSYPNKFHVNFIRSFSDSRINSTVLQSIQKITKILGGINSPYKSPALEAFKEAFSQRYENQIIPLVEVLDEEIGLGYPVGNIRNMTQDGVLNDIEILDRLPTHSGNDNISEFQAFLLNKIFENKKISNNILNLKSSELDNYITNEIELPNSHAVYCTLLAESYENLDKGKYEIIISNGSFTSAAASLSRFSVSDIEIERLCQDIIEEETKIYNGKIVAEVLHSAASRIENISFRSTTRDYELPIETLSSLEPSVQIKLEDIMVTVSNNSVKLISRRHKKEIVPKISNNHAFDGPDSLAIYRFLGDLQLDNQQNLYLWNWGVLSKLKFLPRVVIDDKVICSLATWRVGLEKCFFQQRENIHERLKNHLFEIGLPKYITLRQRGDNLLLLDIEDISCLSILLKEFKKYPVLILHEYLVSSSNSFITDDAENTYTHELIIPLAGKYTQNVNKKQDEFSKWKPTRRENRSFFPGDDVTYVKIYCSKDTGQLVLLKYIFPLIEGLLKNEYFFFLRYEDPDHHIRLRILSSKNSDLIKEIHRRLEPLLSQKLVYRIQYDTYHRELERYSSIPYSKTEMIFCEDSQAMLKILKHLRKQQRESDTWLIALKNVYSYLSTFTLNYREMIDFCKIIRDGYFEEFELGDKEFLKSVNRKLRASVLSIDDIILEKDRQYVVIYDLLSKRDYFIKSTLTDNELRKIKNKVSELASHIHMSINRLFSSDQRLKEGIVYDLLYNYLIIKYKNKVKK